MAKYVPDISTKRWVVIAPSRGTRPHDGSGKKAPHIEPGTHTYAPHTAYRSSHPSPVALSNGHSPSMLAERPQGRQAECPFCTGNEDMTPPEVYRIGDGEPGRPGWQVRVVPNKYPITDIHEVIIHGPDCSADIERLPVAHVEQILRAYRNRYRSLMHLGHVMIFCNHGAPAGASLNHPHSQLVVVPNQINLDALSREPITNVVTDSARFTVYCPDFSQWPFETWIVPKATNTTYADVGGEELAELAGLLSGTLRRIERVLTGTEVPFTQANMPFVYNYYIYHGRNWFLRITPRSIERAGFELGTGLSVNVIDPSIAADMLRRIQLG